MTNYAKFHRTYNDPASILEITPLNFIRGCKHLEGIGEILVHICRGEKFSAQISVPRLGGGQILRGVLALNMWHFRNSASTPAINNDQAAHDVSTFLCRQLVQAQVEVHDTHTKEMTQHHPG